MFEPKFVYQVSRVVTTSEGYTCDKSVNVIRLFGEETKQQLAAARKFTKGLARVKERRLLFKKRVSLLSPSPLVGIWDRCGNDPSAGSPTDTLLRLHLPLNGKV